MLVFGGVHEWHRKLNYVSPFHLYNFSNPPPTLHIEFVAGGLTQPRTVRFFLWFFQLLNCTVANAQLKTKQLVLHDWSYWFQTVPTSHRLFCYVAKLRPSHEFLSTKNSCPTLTTGRRCVSSKNYGKIRIKRNGWNDTVIRFGCMVIPIKKNAFVKLGHFRESNVYDFRNHDAEDHETKYPPWKSNRHFYRVAGEHAVLHHQFLNRIVIRGIVKQEHR